MQLSELMLSQLLHHFGLISLMLLSDFCWLIHATRFLSIVIAVFPMISRCLYLAMIATLTSFILLLASHSHCLHFILKLLTLFLAYLFDLCSCLGMLRCSILMLMPHHTLLNIISMSSEICYSTFLSRIQHATDSSLILSSSIALARPLTAICFSLLLNYVFIISVSHL